MRPRGAIPGPHLSFLAAHGGMTAIPQSLPFTYERPKIRVLRRIICGATRRTRPAPSGSLAGPNDTMQPRDLRQVEAIIRVGRVQAAQIYAPG